MGVTGRHPGAGRIVCVEVACGCLSGHASGQGAEVLSFDIPAQRLDRALTTFARQSNAQLLFSTSSAEPRTSHAVKGKMSASAALDQLLKGSGLHARPTGKNIFTVEGAAPASPASAAASPRADAGASRAAEPVELAAIQVSGDRTHSDLVRPTRQITVIGREALRDLEAGSNNLATVLSKAVPGMADSSHTITDYGQTLRGRNILVLVDGVPLNTNRDSARNLANVDPNNIEKVEVLRGSSAVYGAGATGGIVSITTR